jgi:hypothetical protein
MTTRVWESGPCDQGLRLTLLALVDRMDSGDISISDQVTSGNTSGDISASHNNRKNVERNYNVAALAAELASKERSLQGEKVSSALQQALESEIKTGAEPVAAGNMVLSQVRCYTSAQRNEHFTIYQWSVTNLLAGGYWRDEQNWPWKSEHRPEPKRRYVDPTRLYDGPEYQRRAEGA